MNPLMGMPPGAGAVSVIIPVLMAIGAGAVCGV